MEDNIKICVRDGLDQMLLPHDRDIAASCETRNDVSGCVEAGDFLNN
jgi:hypothetical protein